MIYNGITRAWWIAIQVAMQTEYDMTVNTDSGQASREIHALFLRGTITISWYYTETDQTLVIGCIAKPGWVPESEVEKHITSFVEAAKPKDSRGE